MNITRSSCTIRCVYLADGLCSIHLSRLTLCEQSTGQHWTTTSAQIHPDVDQASGKSLFARQASHNYTATYAWEDGDADYELAEGTSIQTLAAELWNFGKDNDKSQFCADLQADQAASVDPARPVINIDQGNFALQHDSGFTDYSRDC